MAHRISDGLERTAPEAAATLHHESPELLLFQHLLDGTSDNFGLSLHTEHALGAAQCPGLDKERLPDQRGGTSHRPMTSTLQHSTGIHRLRYRHTLFRAAGRRWRWCRLRTESRLSPNIATPRR